ncbi:DsbA family protein [Psychrobacter sp. FDAARGOS_221]|uniref:DsbA family oxidoreductase n=1 Tax=Psychrobacter sp. FDAARGOS_221 TaxID=1975705 RepID=UPI000BB59DCC|nr:DsbA family oxidoreductase [Psychrobacter sp. FDAARGOS_221]PNK59598.1 DsbA family oxidoreductase [Psychrobacter sp. FDAARGOS_221]
MKITYWSDYACPYCYIGEVRLDKAIAQLQSQNELTDNVDIELKAFQLDPNAPLTATGSTLERLAQKYGISAEQARQQIANISQTAREEGLDFDYTDTLFTNTMDAHRLTKYVQQNQPEFADSFKKAVYKAYFIDKKELANRQVLASIASDIGLNVDVNALLDSDEYKEEVAVDQQQAMQLGVRGVPYFVINDKYAIPGAMAQADFENALRQIYQESLDS